HQAEAPEELCLGPAVHGNAVPSDKELAGPEGTVWHLPALEHVLQHSHQNAVEFRKATAQQHGQVDALCVVVEFSPINGQPGCPGEGPRQAVGIEQVPDVVTHASLDSVGAPRISRDALYSRERLEDETGVEMIDEIPLAIDRVVP